MTDSDPSKYATELNNRMDSFEKAVLGAIVGIKEKYEQLEAFINSLTI